MSEKKVIEIIKIEEKEFSCDKKNLTLLEINEDWLNTTLKQNHIEVVLKHLATKIFNSDFYYEKQKVVALINIVKSIRKVLKNEEYKLNLVVRNLKAYQEQEKSKITLFQKQRLDVVKMMISISYNLALNNILKNIYRINTTK